MTRTVSPRLTSYAALAALGVVAGLVSGRVELVALAAPLAVASLAGWLAVREPQLDVVLSLDRERALEGDEVRATLAIETSADRIDVYLPLPPGLRLDGANPRAVRESTDLLLHCDRWGAYALGPLVVRARDRLGFQTWEGHLGGRAQLRVYPSVAALRRLLPPLETQVYVGNRLSRARGDGIEFADVREWAPGDRLRRINWRASARRGELWVNDQHPERNSDVVLFLDTFTDVSVGIRGTLDMTVRAAASIAHRYLMHRDRVGLVSFGGYLSWLGPGYGLTQLYRIVDSVLQMEIVLNFAAKGVDVLPPRSLPPKALVLALSPLLDTRSTSAILDLRARGFDLVVVETSPVPFVEPGEGELAELSYRLWELSRASLRARYERAGVPVVEWRDGVPLQVPFEEVIAFRRYARAARA